MAIYLNTYLVSQEYGGPEEGGWWYETGEPVQSILVDKDADLESLHEEEDTKRERIRRWEFKLAKCYRSLEPGIKKDRISKMLDVLEEKATNLYTSGLLGKYRKMAREITDAITNDRPIVVDMSLGGYQFVVDSPDNDDPTPTCYRGNDRYWTSMEDHFAEYYPQERPHYE